MRPVGQFNYNASGSLGGYTVKCVLLFFLLAYGVQFAAPRKSVEWSGSKEDTGKGTFYWATDRKSYMGFA